MKNTYTSFLRSSIFGSLFMVASLLPSQPDTPQTADYLEVTAQNGKVAYGRVLASDEYSFRMETVEGTLSLPWILIAHSTPLTSTTAFVRMTHDCLAVGNPTDATLWAMKAVAAAPDSGFDDVLTTLVTEELHRRRDLESEQQARALKEYLVRIDEALDQFQVERAKGITDEGLKEFPQSEDLLERGLEIDLALHKLSLRPATDFSSRFLREIRELNPESAFVTTIENHLESAAKRSAMDSAFDRRTQCWDRFLNISKPKKGCGLLRNPFELLGGHFHFDSRWNHPPTDLRTTGLGVQPRVEVTMDS